jgi:hypothetical protein
MGRIPWNKGKKGLQTAWNKGLNKFNDKRIEKYAKKLKISHKGKSLSKTHKDRIASSLYGRKPWNKGLPTPKEVKKKISISLKGDKNHFYRKKHTEESKRRISNSRKGKCQGANNPRYVGDKLEKDKEKIIMKYKKGYSSNVLSKEYNVSNVTILNYLKKWQVKRRKTAYGNNGLLNCKDGHVVRSAYEMIIDDFLFEQGIHHETNNKIFNNKNYQYDFYIPEVDLYIEYWGLQRSEKYSKRMEKKIKLYKENDMNLISIYPKDKIKEKLLFLIPICGKKQKSLFSF